MGVSNNKRGKKPAWNLLEMHGDIYGPEPSEATITHLAFVLFFPFMLFYIYLLFFYFLLEKLLNTQTNIQFRRRRSPSKLNPIEGAKAAAGSN